MTTTSTVPQELSGPDGVVVTRAWPDGDRRRILLEGRDRWGRLRAGRLHLASRPAASEPAEVGCAGDAHSQPTIELAPWAVDRRLPELGPAAAEGELLVHRWGRRAVVRNATGFTKIVRPGRAKELAERTQRGTELAGRAGLVAPAAHQVGEGRVELSTVPGRTLHQGAEFGMEQWQEIWTDWGTIWSEFCSGNPSGLTQRTTAEEVATTVQWVRRAVAYGVLDPASAPLEPALNRLKSQLDATGPADFVLCHRDLHDQQILADAASRRLGLLDLDTLCLADAALDLGNLAVHAQVRVDQGLWSPRHCEVALTAISRVADELAVSPERLDVAVRASGLRLVGVYAFRPRWRELAHRWAALWTQPTHPLSRWVERAGPLTQQGRPLR